MDVDLASSLTHYDGMFSGKGNFEDCKAKPTSELAADSPLCLEADGTTRFGDFYFILPLDEEDRVKCDTKATNIAVRGGNDNTETGGGGGGNS